ncbi:MAG: phosphatase PAP2 family protein [Lewinellaceae bacterium]|nr:phosphatase PAP2 family protein [Lewinellaceae bacterium]
MNLFVNLQDLDSMLFYWINTGTSNALFDAIMPLFRDKWFWAPLYLFIGTFAWSNFGKKGWIIVLGLVATVGFADFSSSSLVKKNVQRLRPCNDPVMVDSVRLRVSCGSGFSFTSSHAANHFAAALYLIGLFGGMSRWVRPLALSWATAIAFSQVYVGVHYPGDVLAGGMLGALIGWWMSRIAGRLLGASFTNRVD